MSTVSLRVPDELLKVAENRAKALHIPRAEYIRRAIAVMNDEVLAHKRRERMMALSKRVRAESMKINAEFDAVEGSPLA
jgi:predicted DNA-binding protein